MITTIESAIENNLTVFIRLTNGETTSGKIESSDESNRIKIRNFEEVMWIPIDEVKNIIAKL